MEPKLNKTCRKISIQLKFSDKPKNVMNLFVTFTNQKSAPYHHKKKPCHFLPPVGYQKWQKNLSLKPKISLLSTNKKRKKFVALYRIIMIYNQTNTVIYISSSYSKIHFTENTYRFAQCTKFHTKPKNVLFYVIFLGFSFLLLLLQLS